MNLSLYELVFGINSKKPILFNLSSTTGIFGNRQLSQCLPCHSLPRHTQTDHLNHHPQNKKVQKGTFAH